jgi:hypothetical protein
MTIYTVYTIFHPHSKPNKLVLPPVGNRIYFGWQVGQYFAPSIKTAIIIK